MKTFREFFKDDNTELDERVDSIQTRLKRAKAARKNRAKMKIGAKKARRRIKIDKKTLMKRAKKQARQKLAKKRLKGANLSDLGLGQKIALSKFLDKKSAKIAKIAKRLVKGIRKKELNKKRKPIVKADKKGIPQKKAS
tara:strand:+ start:25 stop:441 length:417 start_codon:yes stop_codon:yes gene_type:complete